MNAPDKALLSRQYNNRELVPEHPQYFARWQQSSALARSRMSSHLDLAYGEAAGETLDLFPARKGDGSCLMFIHGGYWRSLAWLRPLRPFTYRYGEEQALIERWLALVSDAARRDPLLAREVADCARLIKGYGETHRRGKANFLAIVDALVENPPMSDASEQASAIRKAREAALADPEAKALGQALGKPVVWLKQVART